MRLLDSLVAAVLPKGSGHWRCTAVSIGLTFMLAAAAFAGSLPLRHAWAHFGQEWRRGDAAHPTFASSLGPAPGGDNAEGRLVLQGLWEWLTHDLGAVTGHAAFPGIVSLAFYAVYCLPYFILDCLDLPALRPYKHRGAERPVSGASAWGHTTRHTLWMFVCFILPGVCWQVATRGPWLYANGPDYCVVWCDGKDLFPRLAPTLAELAMQTLTCLDLLMGLPRLSLARCVTIHRRLAYRTLLGRTGGPAPATVRCALPVCHTGPPFGGTTMCKWFIIVSSFFVLSL